MQTGSIRGRRGRVDARGAVRYGRDMRAVFADPKTDLIFKKIFGTHEHKHLLIDLLNALLELDEAHRLADIEYLSPEQLPPRHDLKLSVLDVKCVDVRGTRYVVEMQVIQVEGFQKRIVYNACKAYSSQLGKGEDYPQLNDVIALTVCNFILWPDRQDGGGPYRVPMLSRWRIQEQHGGERGLPEMQYVFLELPKYPAGKSPETTIEKWAWLFREAPNLQRIPDVLAEKPYVEALDVARRNNLSEDEETEYERAKMAEQDFRGGLSFAEKRGREEGRQEGLRQGLIETIDDLCVMLSIELTPERRATLDALDLAGLRALKERIKAQRSW